MTKILKTAGLKFVCSSQWEDWRIKTLLTKEAGTVEWLRGEVKPGDVFYDVGANIGIYTMLAAQLGAHVYAFEPHIFSAASLLQNIALNNFQDRVTVFTCALHYEEGFVDFNYKWLEPGSSGSQLGHVRNESGGEFEPKLTERKWAIRLAPMGIPSSDIIKIDVDGNEVEILGAMWNWFHPPRSIQVEVHANNFGAIDTILNRKGFVFQSKHYTSLGKEAMKEGYNEEAVFYNAIYALGQNQQASIAL